MIDALERGFSSTIMTVGAPTAGTMVGIMSFFEKITPVLTVISLVTGIILGILSYRLRVKRYKRERERYNKIEKMLR